MDGLRALAVFAVFLFHAFPKYLRGGFVGVDVFFVISGFLISSIIFSQLENGSFSFWNFYSRRIRRIYPVLIAVLIASLVFGWFFLLADEFMQLGKHVAAGAGFVSNFVLWFESGYFDNAANTKPLLHLWSLGIEEQFYIVWPFLLWLAWKKRFNLFTVSFLIALVSFILNLHWYKSKPVVDFFSPQTRFWELLCGAMLAWANLHFRETLLPLKERLNVFFQRIVFFGTEKPDSALLSHVLSFLGMLFLVVAVLVTKEKGFPGKWALLPVFATVLLIAAGSNGWFNRKVLSNRVLVWFGMISYPLYLWHWPVLCFARIFLGREPSYLMRAVAFPVCIILAWLTTKLIENPLRFGKYGTFKTIGLFVAMTCVGLIGFTVYKKEGMCKRYSTVVQTLLKIQTKGYKTNEVYLYGCNQAGSQKPDYRTCTLQGKHAEKPTIAIWGDSHASAITYGFREHFRNQYNIWLRETPTCPPVFGTENKEIRLTCQNNNDFIIHEIEINKPKIVVLHAAWHARQIYRDSYKNLDNTITKLRKIGINNILVIGPVPSWDKKLPSLLISEFEKTQKIPARLIPRDYSTYQKIDKEMAKLSHQWNVKYMSPAHFLCNDKGCLTMEDEIPDKVITYDNDHLTGQGSKYLVSLFKDDPFFGINKP
uniref:acyltransferase family protein n=1 Tax=Oxalobacter paraformigenes TaxID=556268 RepID=UPI0005935FB6|nr:acyltransferase family protein [Oxalobacter paraformigenes]